MTAPASLVVSWENTDVLDLTGASPLQLFPANTVALTDIGNVEIGVIDPGNPATFGDLPFTSFEEARVLMDGLAFYGGVFAAARDMVLPLMVKCTNATRPAAAAMDTIRALHRIFRYDGLSKGKVIVTRVDAGGSAIGCNVQAFSPFRPGFANPAGLGPGIFGDLDNGLLLYPLSLRAPHPHFRDNSQSTTGSKAWSGTTVSFTITNEGVNRIGGVWTIPAATGTVSSLRLTNTTTGRYVEIASTFDETIVVDWYGSAPTAWSVEKGGVDAAELLNIGAQMLFVPGDNAMTITGTGTGSVSGMSVTWYDEYDSV